MHGRLYDVRCTDPKCGHIVEDFSNPLCPALGEADERLGDYQEAGSKEADIPVAELPRCAACGKLARPGVVWFGEMPMMLDEISQLVFKADMCLVVGTSSTVSEMTWSVECLELTWRGCDGPAGLSGGGLCIPCQAAGWDCGCLQPGAK